MRFERDGGGKGLNDYWEVTLAGKSMVFITGVVGAAAKGKPRGIVRHHAQTKKYKTAASAKAALAKLIAGKLRQGYRELPADPVTAPRAPEIRNAELEAAIRAAPDDESNYLVYADWLTGQGDPRGELITVQHALETATGTRATALRRRERTLLDRHHAHWFGRFPASSGTYPDPAIARVTAWRRGFFRTIRFVNDDWDNDPGSAELVRDFLALPSSRFVDEILLSVVEWEDSPGQTTTILTEVGKRIGPQIKSIVIGHFVKYDNIDNNHFQVGDLRAPLKRFPALERLTIHSGEFKLGQLALPKLRELALETCALDRATLRAITETRWPALEKLALWFGSSRYGGNCRVADLKPILDGKNFPKLAHLGLMNAEFTDAICEALPRAPILRKLRTLDLSMGCLGAEGVEVLVKHADAFAHLEHLKLDDNFLEPAAIASLKVLGKHVTTADQKDVDDSTNEAICYVSMGE